MDTLIQNPERCRPAESAALHKVLGSPPVRRCAALRQKDISRLKCIPYFTEFGLNIFNGDVIAVGKGRKVELHAAAHSPFQRKPVDGQGRFASVLCGMIMPGRVHVRARVRGNLHDLERPSLSLRQVGSRQSGIEGLHALGPQRMIHVHDFGNHHRRIAGQPTLNGHGKVNEPTHTSNSFLVKDNARLRWQEKEKL